MALASSCYFVDFDDIVDQEAIAAVCELNTVEQCWARGCNCSGQAGSKLFGDASGRSEGNSDTRGVGSSERVVGVEGYGARDSADLFAFMDSGNSCCCNTSTAGLSEGDGVTNPELVVRCADDLKVCHEVATCNDVSGSDCSVRTGDVNQDTISVLIGKTGGGGDA